MPAVAARFRSLVPCLLAGVLLAGCQRDEVSPTGVVTEPPVVDSLAGQRWSDPTTWAPAAFPHEGMDLVIPAGKTVIMDVLPPTLGRLQVDGTLRAHPDMDLAVRAREVHVRGVLAVGSPSRRHTRPFRLTLIGAPSPDVQPTGAKALAVFPGGSLELHGEERVSWTRLSANAEVGATTLELARDVDWRVGEHIVVASTDFDANHAEDAVITAVSGRTITLDKAMRWRHWGTRQQVEGHPVDQRAEVGLLSRNIVIDSDSFTNAGFGGHVIVLPGGAMRVDGVEFHRLGQRGRLARYAVHWHMLGDASGQFVRNASIWRTNNRCLTIHGTDNALAANNVCYDHLGHGYFLEDGSESGNRIEHNLGLMSRVPAMDVRLLASDAFPATFWITHPDNHVEGNVAAGSVGFGFWYALPLAPTGLSTGQADRPRNTPLGVFRNNVAHSNHRPGLQVDDGPKPDGTTEVTSYAPRVGAVSNGAPVTAVFENFVGYKHRGRAIWLRGNSQQVVGAVLSDNMIGGTFANNTTTIERSVVIGETANITAVPNPSFPIRGFEFYDGTVGATAVTFVNFVPRAGRPASAYGYNRNNGFSTATDNFSRALDLRGSNAVYLETPAANKDGDKSGVIRDLDGTLTGHAGWTVVPDVPILRTAACDARATWNAWACPMRYASFRIVSNTADVVAPLTLRRDDAVDVRLVGSPNRPEQANMTLLLSRGYRMEQAPALGPDVRIILHRVEPGDWATLQIPYAGDSVDVLRDYSNTRLPQVATVAAVEASSGEVVHRDGKSGLLTVKLLVRPGRNNTTVQLRRR